jgi:hypothetical protein
MKLKTIALAAMATIVATVAHAQTGTVGFTEIGTPSVTPGTDINGATTFTIGDLASFGNTTGVFTGMANQTYGAVTFNPSVGNSLSFGTTAFGNFTSTSIQMITSSIGFVSIHVLGNYNGGTFDPTIVNDPSSVDISFTQDPIHTGGISDNSVLSIPPSTPTPEPGSLALLGLGASALCVRLRRRKA